MAKLPYEPPRIIETIELPPCHNCVKVTGEKERLIYWLLHFLMGFEYPPNQAWLYEKATKCLTDLGYILGSQRAQNMLALREPGKQ
ncbi:hypothetical protein LCGC14_2337110 [marine sediment metagenome]|uniref:Uncharacterized protein n=1 Tax=marine sediment metagenome TaxID=412755 RepID=A0A0F9CE22_9ZZZZ